MDEAEEELSKVQEELSLVKRGEMDMRSKFEAMKFDNELLQKRIDK